MLRLAAVTFAAWVLAACSGGKDGPSDHHPPADQADADTDADADSDADTDADSDTDVDCEEREKDCAGTCFGDAAEDDCGVCDADPGNDCSTSISAVGSWACGPGEDCQDVYPIDLPQGTQVNLTVDGVTGDSAVRLSAIRPGDGTDGDDVLVGTTKDLACWDPDETATASFVADVGGTWSIVVGRDSRASQGSSGDYVLHVISSQVLPGGPVPSEDDVPSEAQGARCGSEYVIDGAWSCLQYESCQDTFTTAFAVGVPLELAVTDLTGYSVPRLALHAPGVPLGDVNLLTNSTFDRSCGTQDVDEIAPAFTIATAGVHTIAVGRDWDSSYAGSGTYRFTVSAQDAFFSRPVQQLDDQPSLARTIQCEWTSTLVGDWSCVTLQSCQDVYDLELARGSRLSATVFKVSGGSVVRLATYEPGVALSGNNLITGDTTDRMCGTQDESQAFGPLDIRSDGAYRMAIGRDWDTSSGGDGTYVVDLTVEDGYAAITSTVDDGTSQASGTSCVP